MGIPDPVKPPPPSPTNMVAVTGRWRWWYSSISDLMLEHPEWKIEDIATALKKYRGTISNIVNTDLFRAYHQQRKMALQDRRTAALSDKLHRVGEKGLDLILEVMTKKGDQVPLSQLVEITTSTLENLGYGPKGQPVAPVQVNVSQQVMAPVSTAELSEARDILRLAQSNRAAAPMELVPVVSEVDRLFDEVESSVVPPTLE